MGRPKARRGSPSTGKEAETLTTQNIQPNFNNAKIIALYLYADLDQELKPEPKFVVYPGNERYRIKEDVDAISLRELAELLQG